MSFHKLANVLAIMWTCIWTAKCWGVGDETVKTGCGSVEACQRLGGGHNNCITFRISKSILYLYESRCRECSSGSVIFPPQTKMKSWFPTQFQQILNMTSFMAAGLLHWHAWQCADVFLVFFSRTITDNLNMSSCQQFSCVRKEHDERGCNVASSPKSINCTNRERHKMWQQPWKINSNYFWGKRVYTQLPLSTQTIRCGKYLSVSEITKQLYRRQNMYLQNSHLSQSQSK